MMSDTAPAIESSTAPQQLCESPRNNGERESSIPNETIDLTSPYVFGKSATAEPPLSSVGVEGNLGVIMKVSSSQILLEDDACQTSPTLDHHNFSFHLVPSWFHLPHFQYRRVMHEYFANFHFYHPTWLPRGSTVAATSNTIASTIGIGLLSMPYAAAQCGVVLFVIGMAITVALMLGTQHLTCSLVDLTKLHSYEMVSRKVFGSRKPEIFVEVLLMINCFGGTIAYLVIVGDAFQSIISGFVGNPSVSSSVVRIIAQVACFAVVMLPLSMMKSVGALKYASTVSIIAVCILSLFVIQSGMTGGTATNVRPLAPSSFVSFTTGLPLILFGFNNQFNTIEIYSEMSPRSPRQYARIMFMSIGLVALIYLFVGFTGLASFGQSVQGNVLKNFDGSSPFATVAMIGVASKVILSFPLVLFPCREALLHMIGVEDVRNASSKHFYGSTLLIACTSLIIAIFLPNVITLFGLIGSICVGVFAFLLPSALAWMLPEFWAQCRSDNERTVQRVAIIVYIAIGLFLSIAGTTVACMNLGT